MGTNKREMTNAAKIFLGLSLLSVLVDMVSTGIRISITPSASGLSASLYLYIQFLIDFLIIITGISVFMMKKTGLISLICLFVIRIFVFPHGSSVSTAYYIGSNTPKFIVDFVPFAITLCFKKNGISGWRAFFGKDTYVENAQVELKENGEDVSSYSQNEATIIRENKEHRRINPIYSSILLLISLAVLSLFVIIPLTKQFPDYLSYRDKLSVILGIPNNKAAQKCLEMAQSATSSGLSNKADTYMTWCKKFKPNSIETMYGVALYYSLQGDDLSALPWYEKIYEKNPDDTNSKINLTAAYYYTKKNVGKAIEFAESLIEEKTSNSIPYSVLRDYYIDLGNDDAAYYWAICAYNLSQIKTEKDLEQTAKIIYDLCESHNGLRESSSAYIVVSPKSHKVLLDVSEGDYINYLKKNSIKNADAICLKKVIKPEPNGNYYYVYVHGMTHGRIVDNEAFIKGFDEFVIAFPDACIKEIIPSSYSEVLSMFKK